MRAWRQSPLLRGAVVALLLWTAIDLTNAGLCALDNETTIAVTVDAAMLHQGQTPAPSPADAAHVDDCFCCSHCVRAGTLTVLSAPLAVVNAVDESSAGRPHSTADSLFHPPQLLA